LTTGIARIRDSFVIARNTAFTFKGKPVDAKTIGKDLGVRYVLDGSVQLKDQVRVNAQLIDADSGAHLWAEQFDTPRADLLQTQDEIVTHLARAMDIQLPEAEAARLKRTPAANPDAEDLALQCQAVIQRGGYLGEESDAGYRLCERALSTDPNNIRALTWLSAKSLYSVTRASAPPRGRPQAGGRIGVESARPRSKLCQGSLVKGWHTPRARAPRRSDRRARTRARLGPRPGGRR
jgi:hypothetical protein